MSCDCTEDEEYTCTHRPLTKLTKKQRIRHLEQELQYWKGQASQVYILAETLRARDREIKRLITLALPSPTLSLPASDWSFAEEPAPSVSHQTSNAIRRFSSITNSLEPGTSPTESPDTTNI